MKKQLEGIVVSDRMEKSRVLEVTRLKRHPLYQKEMKIRKRYKFHDAANESKNGDRVAVVECRPLSRDKRWRLVRIIEAARVT